MATHHADRETVRVEGEKPYYRVPLSNGDFALVDADDLPQIGGFRWHCMKSRNRRNAYATANVTKEDAEYYGVRVKPGGTHPMTRVPMHLVILGRLEDHVIDHRNGNGLDNRRENLRWATNRGNNANARKQLRPTHSKYKGVTWNARQKRWAAYAEVSPNGRKSRKRLHLGYFHDEREAAEAYNEAATRIWGEFARINDFTVVA